MKIIRVELKDNNANVKTMTEGLNINKKSNNKSIFYYTSKYINGNKNEIKELFNKINTITVEDENAFLKISNIVNCENIVFTQKDSLNVNVLEDLLKMSNLKKIECYFIPSNYIHEFSQKNISIIFHNDYAFDSKFVLYNDLNSLEDIYYKKQINIYSEKEYKNNLNYFLNINKNLRVINLYYYSKDAITFVINSLNEKGLKNVKIVIHQTEDNNLIISNDVKLLKKLNKNYNNNIKILYDDEYFNNRIFKSLTLSGFKLVCVLFMYVSFVLLVSNSYKEYSAALELRRLESEINGDFIIEDNIIDQIDEIDDTNENTVTTTENNIKVKQTVNPYENIPSAFDKLESINKEFVGWIKVNNTMINYPVVKHSDNSYYLSRDIYNKKTTTGWIFMDYRVNENNLNKNTIIYGHALKSGLMFGTLYKTTYKYWVNNEDNLIISFKTKNEDNKYKIFSVYKIDETTDYLRVNFVDDNEFLEFTKMLKERSMYEFDTEIKSTDKIITLSTCSGNNRRLVVHAVKIN